MLQRGMKIKLSPWGAGLVLGLTGLVRMEAQPPPEPSVVEGTERVEGTVSGPQGPLPEGGATVILTLIGEGADPEGSEEQSLQPNGYYLFPQVPPGRYSLRVRAEGFAEIEIEYFHLIVRAGSTNRWDLKLAPQRVVGGRIFKADGTPLADTQVELEYFYLLAQGNPSGGEKVTTDGAGQYEFQTEYVCGKDFQVGVIHPEEGYAFSPVLPYVPGEPPPEVDLHLSPGYSLTGAIQDAETQAPIPGLEFSLRPLAYLVDLVGGLEFHKLPRWPGRTDAKGGFSFSHLAPGIYELSVGYPLGPYLEKKRVLVSGEETTIAVDWELSKRPGPSFLLQLRLPDGSPAADIPVGLDLKLNYQPLSLEDDTLTARLRTDEQGQVRLFLTTGEGVYHLTLTVEGYPPIPLENILVFEGGAEKKLEVVLPNWVWG